MKFSINLLVACLLLWVVSFCAAQTSESPTSMGTEASSADVSTFPYIAEVVGNDVYIRSGPGTNYYNCGKLNSDDKVKVVSTQFSWSRIVPPAGSFSWISTKYVSFDPDNQSIGIVNDDGVRVFAGSDNVRPMLSGGGLQGKIDRGEKVKLLGEQKENYYKIEPPSFAYVWISTRFTKPYVPPIEIPDVPDEPVEVVETTTPLEQPIEPNKPNEAVKPTKPVIAPTVSTEAGKLQEYKGLVKEIKAEQAKPMEEQDFSRIKKSLLDIVNDKNAGKAARYSEYVVKQIERFELAFAIAKQIQLQEVQFKKVQEDIDKARKARLAQVKDLGKFVVIGKLETSNIYGADAAVKYYHILDSSGKTVCYAAASGSVSQADIDKLMGRKVGLVGTLEPHPQTGTALAKFTEISEVE